MAQQTLNTFVCRGNWLLLSSSLLLLLYFITYTLHISTWMFGQLHFCTNSSVITNYCINRLKWHFQKRKCERTGKKSKRINTRVIFYFLDTNTQSKTASRPERMNITEFWVLLLLCQAFTAANLRWCFIVSVFSAVRKRKTFSVLHFRWTGNKRHVNQQIAPQLPVTIKHMLLLFVSGLFLKTSAVTVCASLLTFPKFTSAPWMIGLQS